jgi:hypothetical protein
LKLSEEAGDFDPKATSSHMLPPKPIALDAQIRCCDESGRIVEYVVVDCGTSAVNGDYYVLEEKHVTQDELDVIRVIPLFCFYFAFESTCYLHNVLRTRASMFLVRARFYMSVLQDIKSYHPPSRRVDEYEMGMAPAGAS